MIKRLVVLIISIIIAVSCIFVSALTPDECDISFGNFDKKYTLITENNIKANTDFIESIGFTVQSFENLIEKRNIVCFLGNADNSLQMQISFVKTDFSENVYSLSEVDDDEISVISNGLTGYECETFNFAGTTYFYLPDNNVGNYRVEQFITIKNGGLYTVSFYVTDADITFDEIKDIISSVKIKTVDKIDENFAFGRIFATFIVVILIIALITLTVILALSIYKEVKKQKEVEDDFSNLKIKRRNGNIFRKRRK